ncbi:hypothetical protein BOTBODRAFT_32852 [Botryobasidium botryosum FD-172 SS1]|uniref:Uncharacterized protein n=1 Tax=Botryobasidium botryosum (strain FD-172 SS1) TaxID=930990 RepID=A0A067MRC3_BOTB1|nr:hypothetical protein BOTBODRAFT_32852 [Botryobasidium botryosum FD-172 SS1]
MAPRLRSPSEHIVQHYPAYETPTTPPLTQLARLEPVLTNPGKSQLENVLPHSPHILSPPYSPVATAEGQSSELTAGSSRSSRQIEAQVPLGRLVATPEQLSSAKGFIDFAIQGAHAQRPFPEKRVEEAEEALYNELFDKTMRKVDGIAKILPFICCSLTAERFPATKALIYSLCVLQEQRQIKERAQALNEPITYIYGLQDLQDTQRMLDQHMEDFGKYLQAFSRRSQPQICQPRQAQGRQQRQCCQSPPAPLSLALGPFNEAQPGMLSSDPRDHSMPKKTARACSPQPRASCLRRPQTDVRRKRSSGKAPRFDQDFKAATAKRFRDRGQPLGRFSPKRAKNEVDEDDAQGWIDLEPSSEGVAPSCETGEAVHYGALETNIAQGVRVTPPMVAMFHGLSIGAN